ncbi:MAG TPA: FAD-dependent monooxygenase [Polyangiaceae bacterium]|jgi:2-polyprenyl-6-methoxyphenol hydroxylase-like FAD-dependent oxidoreductase|nr:FAD-dependent monooxygenase [Polyangiaceae bacterium]
MIRTSVLISGAGIAGPALAFCLARRGYDCTVVERAHALRTGGQAVDFRGPVHRDVLERMNLWEPIHARRTVPGDLVMLGRSGETVAALPSLFTGGEVEILRGDLVSLLYERTRRDAEYRFGDYVTRLESHDEGADATFASGATRRFDLVVGADGLHSGIRELAFGDERVFLRHHGYRVATFALADDLGVSRGTAIYSEPGRGVAVGSSGFPGGSRALFVYRGEPFGDERRDPVATRKQLRGAFAGAGWQTARVLDQLDDAADLYVDAVATVHVPRYAQGRVVLLGDAAQGGTLGGQGTALSIVGAYVLAHELADARDHRAAFARYEARMRPYATRCQKGAMRMGGFFAPKTRFGLAARNFVYRALASRPMRGLLEKLVTAAATDFVLPPPVATVAFLETLTDAEFLAPPK